MKVNDGSNASDDGIDMQLSCGIKSILTYSLTYLDRFS